MVHNAHIQGRPGGGGELGQFAPNPKLALGGSLNTIKEYRITLFYCFGALGGEGLQKEILPLQGPLKGQGGPAHI